jgi:hypothetical protein
MVVASDWDPSDPQRVYAGTDQGAVFCSHDCGVSWAPVPIRLPTIAVGAPGRGAGLIDGGHA